MLIRRYIAADMNQALADVKAELGPDALIVAAQHVRGRGLFAPAQVELTVTLADARSATLAETGAATLADASAAALADASAAEAATAGAAPATAGGAGASAPGYASTGMLGRLGVLKREWRLATEQHTVRRDSEDNDTAGRWTAALIELDIEPRLANRLVLRAHAVVESGKAKDLSWSGPAGGDVRLGWNHIQAAIATHLKVGDFGDHRPSVVALVGPTGVGKTTTIAKVAARASLIEERRVALITTDTYRVGAVEQIREYGALIGVPVSVAATPAEFRRAIAEHRSADLTLVDCAGRNPDDTDEVAHLQSLFGDGTPMGPVQIHLTMAATTRRADLQRIIARFRPLDPLGLVFTKLDETRILGALLNGAVHSGLPITCVTFGQRVPEDLARPEADQIARRVVEPARSYGGLSA